MTKNNVTIVTVAKKSGVSKSTVSRVLSNTGRISETTKKKVLDVIAELGYKPNSIAQSLASSKTYNIGVLMPNTSEDFFSNFFFQDSLEGMTRIAESSNYNLLIVTSKQNDLVAVKNVVEKNKIDGIILTRAMLDNSVINYLNHCSIPFVVIGTPTNEVFAYRVDNDNISCSFELTHHLISKGAKKIAFLGGDIKSNLFQRRIEGYKKALESTSMYFDESLVLSIDKGNIEYLTESLLESKNPPDAFITIDDMVCFVAMKKIKEHGLKIPKDFMVASFNNSYLNYQNSPQVTCVDISSRKLGAEAAKMLIGIIEKKDVPYEITIPYQIILRESTSKEI